MEKGVNHPEGRVCDVREEGIRAFESAASGTWWDWARGVARCQHTERQSVQHVVIVQRHAPRVRGRPAGWARTALETSWSTASRKSSSDCDESGGGAFAGAPCPCPDDAASAPPPKAACVVLSCASARLRQTLRAQCPAHTSNCTRSLLLLRHTHARDA